MSELMAAGTPVLTTTQVGAVVIGADGSVDWAAGRTTVIPAGYPAIYRGPCTEPGVTYKGTEPTTFELDVELEGERWRAPVAREHFALSAPVGCWQPVMSLVDPDRVAYWRRMLADEHHWLTAQPRGEGWLWVLQAYGITMLQGYEACLGEAQRVADLAVEAPAAG